MALCTRRPADGGRRAVADDGERQLARSSSMGTKGRWYCPNGCRGSKKHGGADLGPTRAKAAWLQLGVDGKA